jgi:hypothetical protein
MAKSAASADQRHRVREQHHEKEQEREWILTLHRRNRITTDEAEGQPDAIAQESSALRQMLESLDTESLLAATFETHLTQAATLLATLRDRVDEIERTNDWAMKRQIVQHLVARIGVETTAHGQTKSAVVRVRYAFGPSHAVESPTPSPTAQFTALARAGVVRPG